MKNLYLILLLGLSLASYAQDDDSDDSDDGGNTPAAAPAPINPAQGDNKPIGNDEGVAQNPATNY